MRQLLTQQKCNLSGGQYLHGHKRKTIHMDLTKNFNIAILRRGRWVGGGSIGD